MLSTSYLEKITVLSWDDEDMINACSAMVQMVLDLDDFGLIDECCLCCVRNEPQNHILRALKLLSVLDIRYLSWTVYCSTERSVKYFSEYKR